MTLANYVYNPIFGVETYLKADGKEYADAAGTTPEVNGPFGSGSELTGDNLLVSAWTVTSTVNGRPTAGAALQSIKQSSEYNPGDPGAIPESILPGYTTAFRSRNSASFFMTLVDDVKDPQDFNYPILLLLNPPAAYKNQLAGAWGPGGIFSGGTPDFNKSYANLFLAWNLRITNMGSLGPTSENVDGELQMGGTSVPSLSLVPVADAGLDGSYPQIPAYPDVESQVALAASGNYLIPALLDVSPVGNAPHRVTIEWPFSASRT